MTTNRLFCLILVFMLLASGCKKKPDTTATMSKKTDVASLLFEAAEKGNFEQIKSLIAGGADVNDKNHSGDTLLIVAITSDNLDVAEFLISKGADVNAIGRLSMTPLHWAACGGHKNISELLIAKGAHIDAKDLSNETALHCAARYGHKDIVELLFVKGADVNAKGEYAMTPLYNAVSNKHDEVVVMLVDSGADINARRSDGITPMHRALRGYDPNTAILLINKGADVKAKDKNGNTVLHFAARQGYDDVTSLLITKGADVNAKRGDGLTPLHEAAVRGHKSVVQLLIANGADVNAQDSQGDTPLHVAAEEGYEDIVGFLIANGADVDVKSRSGYTPLYFAASHGHIEAGKLLIAEGADVDAQNSQGKTPLFSTALRGHRDMVHLLIAKGANVNTRTASGLTPLHCAAQGGSVNVTEFLISGDASITAQDQDGITPLHEAALRGHDNVVEILLEKGADVNAKTRDGRTALECARAAGHKKTVVLLESYKNSSTISKRSDEKTQDFVVIDKKTTKAGPLTDVESVVLGNSVFAFELYQRLRSPEKNLFFSPYSISTALSMVYAGARGETQMQIGKTLRFALDQEKLHPAFAELQTGLNEMQKSGNFALHIANSLWPQHDYKFLDEYLFLTKKHYGVSIIPVDYIQAGEETRKLINKWVEDKTEDKIKDLILPNSFHDLTRLVLVNAIYFKGNWEHQFDPVKTEITPFYISSEKSVQTSMMNQEEQVYYAESGFLQLLELPYLGNGLSMLVLLPKRIDGLKQLEDSLSIENLELWRRSLTKTIVIISIPRFRIDYKNLLRETLKAMGMIDAFVYPKANFAGMDGKPDWLFLDNVIHQAYVEVNEQGTEAAAATAVGGIGGAPPPPLTFRADHPFLFLIQDNGTESILFIGRVTDPTMIAK